MIKRKIKQILLRRKNVCIDSCSDVNYGIVSEKSGKCSIIKDSHIVIQKMGYGCMLEHVYGYGKIEMGRYVSISGPGTILHSEHGKITIGSFTSIAENVSIQEFNHRLDRVTSAAVNYEVWSEPIKKDICSKGEIRIEEDVLIGSNAVILSGVTIGRGAVIGAGSIVTRDVPRYGVVVGNPAHVMKYKFDQEKIEFLEKLRWWLWDEETIKKNYRFFNLDINLSSIHTIQESIINK